VDAKDVKDHALRRKMITGFMWGYTHPVLVLCCAVLRCAPHPPLFCYFCLWVLSFIRVCAVGIDWFVGQGVGVDGLLHFGR
jgi:hypothetical protein